MNPELFVKMNLVSAAGDCYLIQPPGFAKEPVRVTENDGKLVCGACGGDSCLHIEVAELYKLSPQVKCEPRGAIVEGKPMSYYLTPAQAVMIRVMAARKGIDADEVSRQRFGCEVSGLGGHQVNEIVRILEAR